MTDSQISRIQELIDNNVGDNSRLHHIKDTLEKGKTLYDSDHIYLDSLLKRYFAVKEEPNEKETVSETTFADTDESVEPEKKENSSNDDISILKRKVESLEYNLEQIKKKKKISYVDAIAGAISLTIGIAMVSFGMIAGSSFLFNSADIGYGYGTSGSNSLIMMIGWAVFWIGLLPTVVGVRWISRA